MFVYSEILFALLDHSSFCFVIFSIPLNDNDNTCVPNPIYSSLFSFFGIFQIANAYYKWFSIGFFFRLIFQFYFHYHILILIHFRFKTSLLLFYDFPGNFSLFIHSFILCFPFKSFFDWFFFLWDSTSFVVVVYFSPQKKNKNKTGNLMLFIFHKCKIPKNDLLKCCYDFFFAKIKYV